ncbi:zf-HC2 domain-containing protein [Kitasatospora sp. NPDC097643]|uniref:zf-HC2 domain-containing protein n=1 Tax=Kitasatospora sp. NPDC097643 TaxID=3157230 RepID=UPI0033250623
MRCAQFRTALSARLDGEPTGLPGGRLDKHIARCAGCREWLERAERLRDRTRLAVAATDGPSADWSARLLAGLGVSDPGGQARGERTPGERVPVERAPVEQAAVEQAPVGQAPDEATGAER